MLELFLATLDKAIIPLFLGFSAYLANLASVIWERRRKVMTKREKIQFQMSVLFGLWGMYLFLSNPIAVGVDPEIQEAVSLVILNASAISLAHLHRVSERIDTYRRALS